MSYMFTILTGSEENLLINSITSRYLYFTLLSGVGIVGDVIEKTEDEDGFSDNFRVLCWRTVIFLLATGRSKAFYVACSIHFRGEIFLFFLL